MNKSNIFLIKVIRIPSKPAESRDGILNSLVTLMTTITSQQVTFMKSYIHRNFILGAFGSMS